MLLELALLLLAILGFALSARKAAQLFPNRAVLLIFWTTFAVVLIMIAVAGYWTMTYMRTKSAQIH